MCSVLNAAGLGAPWLTTTDTSFGTVTTTVTLTKFSTHNCPPTGACTDKSGTTGGIAKAGGDASIGLLTLSFILLFSIVVSSIGTVITISKTPGAPIARKVLDNLRLHIIGVTLLTYATVIAYPAAVLPATTLFPGDPNVTVAYGGGFAVIIVNCFLTLGMLVLVQSLIDSEDDGASAPAPAQASYSSYNARAEVAAPVGGGGGAYAAAPYNGSAADVPTKGYAYSDASSEPAAYVTGGGYQSGSYQSS